MEKEWLNTVDEEGHSILSRASGANHMALTAVLLQRDGEDRSEPDNGSFSLHKAAFAGQFETVKQLLEFRADVNALDKYNETPLHKAVRQGHTQIVRVLIDHSANVNAGDVFGLTVLHWVALTGNAAIAEMLIEAGADPFIHSAYLDDLSPRQLADIMGHQALQALFDR